MRQWPYRFSGKKFFKVDLMAVFYVKDYFVGNKTKGQISKRVFQENKARQVYEKQTFFTP